MKKILITGANSYIGTSFEKYIEENYQDDYHIDTLDMINPNWKECDFSGYDSIFHVAGIAHADVGHVSEERKKLYYQVNCDLAYETAIKVKESKVKPFREVVAKRLECAFQKPVPTDKDLERLAEVRQKVRMEGYLGVKDTRVLVKFGTDEEVSDYIENNFLYSSLLAEYCSDEVVLKYAEKKQISVTNLLKMLEKGRLKLIEKIQEVYSLNAINPMGRYFPHIETLIKHGCQYLLKTQIQKYGAWYEPQEILLINTGDTEMIRFYLEYHNFMAHPEAQRALIGLKQPGLVELYQKKYGFDKECYQLAVDNGLLSA